jgi:hypothetical protein
VLPVRRHDHLAGAGELAQQRSALLKLRDGDLGLEDRAPPAQALPTPEAFAEGVGQPPHERPELEKPEQLHELVTIDWPLHQIEGSDLEGHVTHQRHHLGVGACLLLVCLKALPQLGRLLRGMGEDPVEIAVGGDQLRRGLLPDTGNSGQVV